MEKSRRQNRTYKKRAFIADAVVYLSSDSARSITGITVVIDNGALLLSDKRERYGF